MTSISLYNTRVCVAERNLLKINKVFLIYSLFILILTSEVCCNLEIKTILLQQDCTRLRAFLCCTYYIELFLKYYLAKSL